MTARKKATPKARKKALGKKALGKKPLGKTHPTGVSVARYLAAVEGPERRRDVRTVAKLFRAISGKTAKMWGSSIVGFGAYHYKYASGREGDGPRLAFSPRRQNLVIYIMPGFADATGLLEKLGKHKVGKSCLYLNRLDDIDLDVLEQLARLSWLEMERRYPE